MLRNEYKYVSHSIGERVHTCVFREHMASRGMRGHQADGCDITEHGALLQHLKKGGCDVPLARTNADNKLCYPADPPYIGTLAIGASDRWGDAYRWDNPKQ